MKFFETKSDYNKPKKIVDVFDNKYIKYKKEGDEKQSIKQHL